MGMKLNIGALLLVLVGLPGAVYGVQIIVGDSAGWSAGFNYQQWVTTQTFNLGDSLLFNYDSFTHKVDVVNQNDYKSCSSRSVLKSYSDGTTTIPLNTAGPMYFICPSSSHCVNGMKLQINVLATSPPSSGGPPATTPPSTTTPSPPTTPDTTPGTPGITSTSAAPPPPPPSGNGAAATRLASMKHLVFGILVVLATVVGF